MYLRLSFLFSYSDKMHKHLHRLLYRHARVFSCASLPYSHLDRFIINKFNKFLYSHDLGTLDDFSNFGPIFSMSISSQQNLQIQLHVDFPIEIHVILYLFHQRSLADRSLHQDHHRLQESVKLLLIGASISTFTHVTLPSSTVRSNSLIPPFVSIVIVVLSVSP